MYNIYKNNTHTTHIHRAPAYRVVYRAQPVPAAQHLSLVALRLATPVALLHT